MLRLMFMRMLGTVLLVVLSVSACGDDPTASTTACGVNDGPAGTEPAEAYIGLTSAELEAAADQADFVVRVLGEDGDCTGDRDDDRRGDRVNVYLEDDRVTAARVF
jgi:hypothetical protein